MPDDGRGALTRQHEPQAPPGPPLFAIERVMPGGDESLEPRHRRFVRAVGAGACQIGRDLAIARREIGKLLRAEPIEAAACRSFGQSLKRVPSLTLLGDKPRSRSGRTPPRQATFTAGQLSGVQIEEAGDPSEAGWSELYRRAAATALRRAARERRARARRVVRRTATGGGIRRRRAQASTARREISGRNRSARVSYGRSRATTVPATRSPRRFPRG